MNHETRIKRYLFLFFLTLYLLSAGNHFTNPYYTVDERFMIITTYALAENFSLQIPEMYGQTASKYGILPSVAAVPLYLAGKWIARLFPYETQEFIFLYFIYSLNAIVTALLAVFFYSFSRYLRYPRKTAVYSTLVLGLCTIVFPFAKYFFTSPLVSLFMLASFYQLVKYQAEGKRRNLVVCSVWFGLMLLTRIDGLSLAFIYALALFVIHVKRTLFEDEGSFWRGYMRDGLIFALPVLAALLVFLLVNYLKFGAFFETGYSGEAFTTNLLIGLYGLFLSTGRGLIFFSPPVILSFFCLRRFWKKHPLVTVLVIGAAVLRLSLFSKWWAWHGGLSWGPRLIIPIVPLLMLFMNETLLRYKRFPGGIRAFILLVILAGLFVQLVGVLTGPAKLTEDIYPLIKGDETHGIFIPQLSGIFYNLNLIRTGVIDSFIVDFPAFLGFPALILVLATLACLLFASLLHLLRLAGCKAKDFISWKPLKECSKTEKLIAAWLALNVFLYLLCFLGLINSGIPRYQLTILKDGSEKEYRHNDSLIFIDSVRKEYERTPPEKEDIKEVRMKWKGFIRLPLEGDYYFHVKCRGRYVLLIDEEIIAANAKKVPQFTKALKKKFKSGYHKFEAEYIPHNPYEKVFHLYITLPGFGVYKTVLSSRYLSMEKPSPLRRFLIHLDTYKAFILILSAMLVYATHLFLIKKEENYRIRHKQG